MPDELRTNIRQYLNRIANGSGIIPNKPNSNIEYYLNKIATGTGETPEPGTNIEHYLYHIANKSGDIPEPHTDLEKFLYHIATENGDVPTPHTEVETLLKQIIDGGGGGGDFDPTTFSGIQKIVRAGKAQEYFSIGDEINIAKYTSPISDTTYDFPLIVADFKNATLQNGTSVPAMMLLSKYTLDVQMPLSPTGDVNGTTYSNGYSRWDWDMQRQWLNASGNNWFVNHFENSSDVSQYTDHRGFLSCISNDLADVLTPTKVDTFLGPVAEGSITTHDKFFTLSLEQYYLWNFVQYPTTPATLEEQEAMCTGEGGIVEYFKQAWLATGATTMRISGSIELPAQVGDRIDGYDKVPPECWMRSPSSSHTNHKTTGSSGNRYANRAPKVELLMRPATIIC